MVWFAWAAATVLMIVFGWLYVHYTPKYGKKYLPFKGLATLMAAVIVTAFSVNDSQRGRWLFAAAIIVCALADIALDIYFPVGVVVFLGAQILFITALLQYTSFGILTAVIVLAVVLLFVISYFKHLKDMGPLLIPAVIYVTALGSMCALGITAAVSVKTAAALCSAVGGLLFITSDYVLVSTFLELRSKEKFQGFIMVTYYGAVYLLAISGCFI